MVNSNINIEGAKIGFRNFKGIAGKFNAPGKRNFCVFFDQELGKTLENDGWNIRWLQPKSPDDDSVPYMQVAVSFDNIPPKIVLVTRKGKTKLDEESIDILDWAEIQNVDLIIRPYNWTVKGDSGVKGYVKTMYVTIAEDEFEGKYYDVPDSAVNVIGDGTV
jgi:hypothetical protein